MWPFRRTQKKKKNIAKKMVVGVIVGGAIGSIVGKKLMEKHGAEDPDDEDEDGNGFSQRKV